MNADTQLTPLYSAQGSNPWNATSPVGASLTLVDRMQINHQNPTKRLVCSVTLEPAKVNINIKTLYQEILAVMLKF